MARYTRVLDTTLYDQVCQWLVAGQMFFMGTPVSSTNKIYRSDIAEIIQFRVGDLGIILYKMSSRHFIKRT
jgi:hypothetical protein